MLKKSFFLEIPLIFLLIPLKLKRKFFFMKRVKPSVNTMSMGKLGSSVIQFSLKRCFLWKKYSKFVSISQCIHLNILLKVGNEVTGLVGRTSILIHWLIIHHQLENFIELLLKSFILLVSSLQTVEFYFQRSLVEWFFSW